MLRSLSRETPFIAGMWSSNNYTMTCLIMLAALFSMSMKSAPPNAAYPRVNSTAVTQPTADLVAVRHTSSHPRLARRAAEGPDDGGACGWGADIVSQFVELRLLTGRTALL